MTGDENSDAPNPPQQVVVPASPRTSPSFGAVGAAGVQATSSQSAFGNSLRRRRAGSLYFRNADLSWNDVVPATTLDAKNRTVTDQVLSGIEHFVAPDEGSAQAVNSVTALSVGAPFPVLKALGIVHQTYTKKDTVLTHDPIDPTHFKGKTPLFQPGNKTVSANNCMKYVTDQGPTAALRLIGSLYVENFLPEEESGKYTADLNVYNDAKKSGGGVDKSEGGFGELVDGPFDKLQLDEELAAARGPTAEPKAALRFIKQYLVRSLPEVAVSNAAMCVVSGDSYLNTLLGRGVFMRGMSGRGPVGSNAYVLQVKPRTQQDTEAEKSHVSTHQILLIDQKVKVGEDTAQKVPAAPSSVSNFVKEMLTDLSKPIFSATPTRLRKNHSKVVYVLIGGESEVVKSELLHAVKHKWPIFVIEGSHGYAGHLASTIRRIEEICKNPSMDDYRAMLGTGDASTAEILINGNVKLVEIGTSAEEFGRMVDVAMRGDNTLRQAWHAYARWNENAEFNRGLTMTFQAIILMLSIVATTLSIVMTFLQIQYPDRTSQRSSTETGWLYQFYSWGNLVLIALPILTSLFQAILIQTNPTGKWGALRRAAELLKREIYLYRTQTRKYSSGKILKSQNDAEQRDREHGITGPAADKNKAGEEAEDAQESDRKLATLGEESGSPVAAGDVEDMEGVDLHVLNTWDDSEPYYSRSDLLYRRINALSEEILASVTNAAMSDYTGPLPPLEISETGDDGYSDLSPEEYALYRLQSTRKQFEINGAITGRHANAMNFVVYTTGALGTILAGVALQSDVQQYNLQAWVALTTAIQNAFTRHIDYTRIEFFHKAYVKAKEKLTNVESWWAQLQQPGMRTDAQENRDLLVGLTEAHITREVEESGAQLKTMIDRLKKAQAEGAAEAAEIRKKLISGQELAKVKAMKQMGLTSLNPKTIQAALRDPNSKEAKEIGKSLNRLNEALDGQQLVEEALGDRRMAWVKQQADAVKQLGEDAIDAAGNLKEANLGGFKMATLLSPDVMNLMSDPSNLLKLKGALNSTSLKGGGGRPAYLSLLSKLKRDANEKLVNLPHRQLLTALRSMLQRQLLDEFEEALDSIGVVLYDLVEERAQTPELVSELRAVASMSWATMDLDSVLKSIKDPTLRVNIEGLGEAKIRSVFRRAQHFFSDPSQSVTLMDRLNIEVAEIDVEDVLSKAGDLVARARLRRDARKRMSEHRLELHSREELLMMLPATMRVADDILNKTAGELAEYVKYVANGSLASQAMDVAIAFIRSVRPNGVNMMAAGGLGQANGATALDNLLRTVESRERLLRCVVAVDSGDLYAAAKDAIIRQLSVAPQFTEVMGDDLRQIDPKTLRDSVLAIKATLARPWVLQLFDEVVTVVDSFDLQHSLPTLELRLQLLNRIDQFRGLANQVSPSPTEIMKCCAVPQLVARLYKLTPQQLAELVNTLLVMSTNPFFANLLSGVIPALETVDINPVRRWTDMQAQRLVREFLTRPPMDPIWSLSLDDVSFVGGSRGLSNARSGGFRPSGQTSGTLRGEQQVPLLDRLNIVDNSVYSLLATVEEDSQRAIIRFLREKVRRDPVGLVFFSTVSHLLEGNIVCDASPVRVLTDENVQQELLLLTAEVMSMGLMDANAEPEDRLEGIDNDLVPSLETAFGTTVEGLSSLVSLVEHTIRFSAPVIIFEALADSCVAFDLRGLISTFGLQVQLITGIVYAQQKGAFASHVQDFSATNRSNPAAVVDTELAARTQLIRTLTEEDGLDYVFDDIVFCLRGIDDAHFATVMTNFRSLQLMGKVGDIDANDQSGLMPAGIIDSFSHMVAQEFEMERQNDEIMRRNANANGEAGFDEAALPDFADQAARFLEELTVPEIPQRMLHMRIAMAYFRRKCTLTTGHMYRELHRLDANSFIGAPEEDRVEHLLHFVSEQETVQFIAKMELDELKEFFGALRGVRSVKINVSVSVQVGDVD